MFDVAIFCITVTSSIFMYIGKRSIYSFFTYLKCIFEYTYENITHEYTCLILLKFVSTISPLISMYIGKHIHFEPQYNCNPEYTYEKISMNIHVWCAKSCITVTSLIFMYIGKHDIYSFCTYLKCIFEYTYERIFMNIHIWCG